MSAWVHRSACGGVANNGTTSHTCTFTSAGAGSLLIAIVAGAVTSSTPSGWTLIASAVNNGGLYLFSRTATAGDSSFTTTHNGSDYAIEAVVYEYAAGSVLLGTPGTATAQNTAGSAVSGPAATSLSGSYTRFTAREAVITGTTNTTTTAWTTPSVSDYDVTTPHNTSDGIGLTIAYDDSQTGASFTAQSTMTAPTGGTLSGEGIAWAVTVAASGSAVTGTGSVTVTGNAIAGAAAGGSASATVTASANVRAAAGGSGSAAVTASANVGAAQQGSGSFTITAAGVASAAITGGAQITVTALGNARGAVSGAASLSITSAGAAAVGSVAVSGTASLTFTATAPGGNSNAGASLLSGFYQDVVTVLTYLGRGARGDTYSSGLLVACYVDDDRKLMLGPDGTEVMSETTIYTDPAELAKFTSGTLVSIGATTSKVISVRNRRHPLAPDINHLEIGLV